MSTPIPFSSRWLITGTFTTRSELHIGDGGAGSVSRRSLQAAGDDPEASTVRVDYRGRAYVPGSGIKGALRARLGEDINKEPWRTLFGSDKPDAPDAVGGKLEFWDAFHSGGAGNGEHERDPENLHTDSDRTRPWWDDNRKTCVTVAVSLDRRTRTARENLLFSLEYVPVGETFTFKIGGDNLGESDIAGILALLDSFGSTAATLGAGASNGWGRLSCEVKEILRLDAAALTAWKKNPVEKAVCLPIDATTRQRIDTLKPALPAPPASETLVIGLALLMESPWLIRDARQRERREHAPANMGDDRKPPNAVPIHDETGKPFIPSRSLRGALRTRAEMILRTLDLPCADHPGDITAVTTKGKTPEDVLTHIADTMDLAAKLFGFSGWQAPLQTPRFTPQAAPAEHHQEFVAIDRFTGGAADGAKFDAVLAGMTPLAETLAINLRRLREVDPEFASLGLLALVLRDLAEGDIPLGSGAAKGQGRCLASVTWNGTDLSDPACDAARYLTAFRKSISTTAQP